MLAHRARLRVVEGEVDVEIEHAYGGVHAHGLRLVCGDELRVRRRLVAGAEVELGGVVARASAAVIAAQDLALIASDGAPSESGGPSALDTLDAVARRLREAAAAGAGLGVCGGVRASGCWRIRLARRPPSGWRWRRCQGGGTRSGATTRSAREDAVSEVRRRVGDEARHVRVEVWASSSGAAALDRTPARGSTSAAKLAHPSGSLLMTAVEGGIAEEGELRAMGCLRGGMRREREAERRNQRN